MSVETKSPWHSQRDQLSRTNMMINREYIDHFTMRLATEMVGCVWWCNHDKNRQEAHDFSRGSLTQ